MKRLTTFLTILVLTFQCMMAQMSDSQIVSYAKQRQGAGASAQTIGQELLAKGATKEQIQRVYAEFNKAAKGDNSAANANVNRLRKNNGEEKQSQNKKSKKTRNSRNQRARNTGGDYRTRNNGVDNYEDDIDFEDYYGYYQEEDSTAIKIFGHDIFRSDNLSFEPSMNIATPQDYVLGPGDELIVDVYGTSQTSEQYTVAPDGTVTIPRVGPIGVSGLTVDAAKQRIAAALGSHYDKSAIKISVGQTRTISINVMGEVQTPGTYTLSAFASVFHALYMAGGTNELGTLRNIQVARKGKIISTVDVYEYILNGRLAGNVQLQDNDVIIVGPYQNLVNIAGNVRRPMWYEMKKNESLEALLKYAGGFAGAAYTKSLSVERTAGDKRSVYTVNEEDFKSFILADQDSVSARENEKRYNNSVLVQGAVKRPGNYELSKVITFRKLIEQAGGLDDEALTNRAVLIRTKPDFTKEAMSIDIMAVLEGRMADVVLQNEDIITIASLSDRNVLRTLTIEGEVYNPGIYEFASGLTVEDLITLAGGLRESASLLNVEVARRIVDPAADKDLPVNCETFNFTLEDGMPVANGSNFSLQPYDQVYVRKSPVYVEPKSVNISGEVVFAGNYALNGQEVRISEIVKRAGGFKEKASVIDARLIRKMNEDEIALQEQKLEMAEQSSDSIDFKKEDLKTEYSVGINLSNAIKNPGSDDDIVLRDGDQIIVPSYTATVKISGEVLYPNVVTYLANKSKSDYISQAGGFTKESLKRRAYIIYANGQVSKLSKGKIMPGCEIVVPKKTKHNNTDNAMKWISIASSVASTAAVILNVVK